MSHELVRRAIAVLALAFTGATLLAFSRSNHAQEVPPPADEAPLADRVTRLEQQLAEQQKELLRMARLTRGMAAGVAELAAAGESAAKGGFVEAGANPGARQALLNGIAALQAQVKQASAPPPARRD